MVRDDESFIICSVGESVGLRVVKARGGDHVTGVRFPS